MLFNPVKIMIIVNLPPPMMVKQLRATLGHMGYYKNFIRGHTTITTPMEKMLKKDAKFEWIDECQGCLNTLKKKMVTSPILFFLDWTKRFHIHIDASSIALGVILAHLGEGVIDHPISFSIWKLSIVETNYMTTKQEGLVIVYALQKFCHYLLGGNFKMFIDHSTLKYLVNKPMLGGNICRWLLLF